MPDFGVHVTIINDTDKPLQNDPRGTTARWGHWVNVPLTISPRSTSARFVLQDSATLAGSEGDLSYFVGSDMAGSLRTYQTCPWGNHSNMIKVNSKPSPLALYYVSFRARSGNGPWLADTVQSGGHPVEVEYTLSYERHAFRFRLDRVTSNSAHPIRNSRGALVVGQHELWTQDAPDKYEDGLLGSFQPNIFSYDFRSSVAESGHLNVTVTPLDIELIGAEVILYGAVNGTDVFQTDFFFFKTPYMSVTVSAHAVQPETSDRPFASNADVQWRMELRYSGQGVQAVGAYTTQLELYWIARTTHRAFHNSIPVGFLRDVLGRTFRAQSSHAVEVSETQEKLARFEFYADMTRDVFGGYHKIYDTVSGASACGMAFWGGNFWESYYRAHDGSGISGTLVPYINCMDQAAMLELSCSLLGGFSSTSWLGQSPFGYINTTHLVGIVNTSGQLIDVNNPFFGTQPQYAHVDQNDSRRTWFGCHVYVGHSRPFDSANDAIYDACAGPHLGESAQSYIANSIDTTTTLYQSDKYPGNVQNIQAGMGVTGIDGAYPVGGPTAMARSGDVLNRLLAGASPRASAASIVHKDWAHGPEWVAGVLGERWTVRFGSVVAEEERAHAFFHISDGTDSHADHVRVSVYVHTKAGADGVLDREGSVVAARESAAAVIGSTDRDPETLWVAGEWNDYGDWSLQYRPDIGGGRVLVSAASTIVDIAGFSSTTTLADIARRLLDRVVYRNAPRLDMPVLRGGRVVSSEDTGVEVVASPEPATPQVTSVRVGNAGTRFSLSFEADGRVAAAGATCSSPAMLFDKYVVEEFDPRGGQGDPGVPMSAVVFTFYAREVGHQTVRIHVADSETMLTTTRIVEVEVV